METEISEDVDFGAAQGEPLSLVDIGTEAMLEIEELRQGLRSSAPSLIELLGFIRTPVDNITFAGNIGMSMLADVRAYTVLRDATGVRAGADYKEFARLIEDYLSQMEEGVLRGDKKLIEQAKKFCTVFVNCLIEKNMSEVYLRKETADARLISDALI